MSLVQKVKEIDKMTSKYFIPFSIVFFAFAFGWTYADGETIFSSFLFFIVLKFPVVFLYLSKADLALFFGLTNVFCLSVVFKLKSINFSIILSSV